MKLKRKQALHQKTPANLQAKLDKLVAKLTTAKLNIAAGKQKNTSLISDLKNQIAIIKTILKVKELNS